MNFKLYSKFNAKPQIFTNLEDVYNHGREVTEEEDHDDTQEHARQPQLPSLGPGMIFQ